MLTREGKDYLEYTKARNSAKAETRRAVQEYEREIAKIREILRHFIDTSTVN